MFELRWYQRAAVDAVWSALRNGTDNPCVEIPTGGGKSAVIATIASEAVTQWGGRVIVLAHVKELLEQNAQALLRVCPGLDVGIYSAGLGLRQTGNSVVVAGIQSVAKKAAAFGRRDLVLIDESHLITPSGDGQYRTFIQEVVELNPQARVIGLTATPYRMSTGLICGKDNILNSICYRVGVRALIAQGFLSKLISKRGLNLDFSGLHIERGEFSASEADKLMCDVVPAAVGEILKHTSDRKSVLLFCQSRDHAKAVQDRLAQQGASCGYIDGDSLDRAETLSDFKAGSIKYLVNVNVLTTGFDAPNIDCIGLLRPTVSPGLYYQMVGRGFRIAEGKQNCLILDFGGNVARHGPVDAIEVRGVRLGGKNESLPLVKTCPNCDSLIAPSYAICPDCGHVFPAKEAAGHDRTASEDSILSEPETFDVKGISYCRHLKRDADDDTPATFRVDYRIGVNQFISEYVCFEHTGYVRKRAEKWWAARSPEPCPASASEAMGFARQGLIAETKSITAVQKGRFWNISEAVIGDRPESVDSLMEVAEDDIPF